MHLTIDFRNSRYLPRQGDDAFIGVNLFVCLLAGLCKATYTVWLGGRVVRTLDLRSIGREFDSRPLCYRVQSWASC